MHLFDLHQRDRYSLSSTNGNAVLLIFQSMEEFIRYTGNVYDGYQFEITPVCFGRFTINNRSRDEPSHSTKKPKQENFSKT